MPSRKSRVRVITTSLLLLIGVCFISNQGRASVIEAVDVVRNEPVALASQGAAARYQLANGDGVCGDLNDDGLVNVLDVISELRIIVDGIDESDPRFVLGDVVPDGQIDIDDADLQVQNIVGLKDISECGVGQIVLPGRIEAENYKEGGEGVGYHDTTLGNNGGAFRDDDVDIEETTDAGGGFNIGWGEAGEWLAYDVIIDEAGVYDLTARVASEAPGDKTLHIELDGIDITGPMTFPSTGGWQVWTNVTASGVSLDSGIYELRIVMDSSMINLNYVDAKLPVPIECPASVPGDEGAPNITNTSWNTHPNNSLIFEFDVEVDQPAHVWVEYQQADGEGHALTTSITGLEANSHEFQVMRLWADTDYCFQIFAADQPEAGLTSNSVPGNFRTGSLPAGLAAASFTKVSGSQTYDVTVMDVNNDNFSGYAAVDDSAEVVWYYQHQSDVYALDQKDNFNLVFGELDGTSLIEIRPDGSVLNEISDELPDGTPCEPAGR